MPKVFAFQQGRQVIEACFEELQPYKLLAGGKLGHRVMGTVSQDQVFQLGHPFEEMGRTFSVRYLVDVLMAQIDGDHVVAVAQILRHDPRVVGKINVRIGVRPAEHMEKGLIRSHAPVVHLDHPNELHVVVPQVDRLHVFVGYPAAEHLHLFQVGHRRDQRLYLLRVRHGKRDIVESEDLIGCGERHAEPFRPPETEYALMRLGKADQARVGKSGVRKVDLFNLRKKGERRIQRGEVFFGQRLPGEAQLPGILRRASPGDTHGPPENDPFKFFRQGRLLLRSQAVSFYGHGPQIRQTAQRRGKLTGVRLLQRQVRLLSGNALPGERHGPHDLRSGQGLAKSADRLKVGTLRGVNGFKTFKPGKQRDVSDGKIARDDLLFVAGIGFSGDRHVVKDSRIGQGLSCRGDLLVRGVLSPKIQELRVPREDLSLEHRISRVHDPRQRAQPDRQGQQRRQEPRPRAGLFLLFFHSASPFPRKTDCQYKACSFINQAWTGGVSSAVNIVIHIKYISYFFLYIRVISW